MCNIAFVAARSPEEHPLEWRTASIESFSDDIDMALPVSGGGISDLPLEPTQLLQLKQLSAKGLHSAQHGIWREAEGPCGKGPCSRPGPVLGGPLFGAHPLQGGPDP